jgi:hypothetical protein
MIKVEYDIGGFQNELDAFIAKAKRKNREIFSGAVKEVQTSVKVGSGLTGAPGQAVDTGFLLGSWRWTTEGPLTAVFSTPVKYALAIEEGRPVTRAEGEDRPRGLPSLPTPRPAASHFHSVKLTRGGWKFIVDDVAKRVGP